MTETRQARATDAATRDVRTAIVDVVLELLESEGHDAVQLRLVARRARVSLTTVYKLFPTRDDLIVTAIEQWMAVNCYDDPAPAPPGESLADGLMRVYRYLFEPWEHHERMLQAYHRARLGPGGERLDRQGRDAIIPLARAVLDGADPDYAADIEVVLTNMAYAVVGRAADGELPATEMLPALERAVRRLTADNAAEARRAASGDRRRPTRPDRAARR